jgi:ribonuclease HI
MPIPKTPVCSIPLRPLPAYKSRKKLKKIDIFTDGACKGNPGPGGWGAILRMGNHEKELSGCETETTNNRMEMTAVIRALKVLTEPCAVTVHTDSRYVIDGMTKWIEGWKRKGWVNASKQPVRNQDLWHDLIEAVLNHQIKWQWVKGHDGHPENERADKLASDAALSVKR